MKKIHDDDIKKAFQSLHIPPAEQEKVEKAAKESASLFAELNKNKKDERKSKGFQETGRLMGKIKQLFFNSEGEPIMTRTQFAGLSVATIAVVLTITIQSNNLKPIDLQDTELRRIQEPKTPPPATEREEGMISSEVKISKPKKIRDSIEL